MCDVTAIVDALLGLDQVPLPDLSVPICDLHANTHHVRVATRLSGQARHERLESEIAQSAEPESRGAQRPVSNTHALQHVQPAHVSSLTEKVQQVTKDLRQLPTVAHRPQSITNKIERTGEATARESRREAALRQLHRPNKVSAVCAVDMRGWTLSLCAVHADRANKQAQQDTQARRRVDEARDGRQDGRQDSKRRDRTRDSDVASYNPACSRDVTWPRWWARTALLHPLVRAARHGRVEPPLGWRGQSEKESECACGTRCKGKGMVNRAIEKARQAGQVAAVCRVNAIRCRIVTPRPSLPCSALPAVQCPRHETEAAKRR